MRINSAKPWPVGRIVRVLGMKSTCASVSIHSSLGILEHIEPALPGEMRAMNGMASRTMYVGFGHGNSVNPRARQSMLPLLAQLFHKGRRFCALLWSVDVPSVMFSVRGHAHVAVQFGVTVCLQVRARRGPEHALIFAHILLATTSLSPPPAS